MLRILFSTKHLKPSIYSITPHVLIFPASSVPVLSRLVYSMSSPHLGSLTSVPWLVLFRVPRTRFLFLLFLLKILSTFQGLANSSPCYVFLFLPLNIWPLPWTAGVLVPASLGSSPRSAPWMIWASYGMLIYSPIKGTQQDPCHRTDVEWNRLIRVKSLEL